MSDLPPRVVALIDQARAELDALTAAAREHRAHGCCTHPDICPGGATLLRVLDRSHMMLPLLAILIAERANAGAGGVSRDLLIESVAGTLLACNSDIVVDADGAASFVEDKRWTSQARLVVDELARTGLLGGGR